jgi:hypothetical protein
VGTEFGVANALSNSAPTVAMSPDGEFVVAWQTAPGGQSDLFARRYASDGTPVDAQFPLNTYVASDQNLPVVAMDARGNFVAAWEGQTQVGGLFSRDVFARLFLVDDGPSLDSFKCYFVRETDSPESTAGAVSLSDQFGVDDGLFAVGRSYLLCNPAAVNGAPPLQEAEHLACRKIASRTLLPSTRPVIQSHDVFGDHRLEIVRSALVCLPSSKEVLP